MDLPAQLSTRLRRGVHRVDWLLNGLPALIAVDRQGNLRAVKAVPTPYDELDVERALWDVLDEKDPLPLRLHEDPARPPARPRPLTREELRDVMTPAQRAIAFGPSCRPSRAPRLPRR